MVFINQKKYACESCIKGHRSSNCAHNDRPLFEIKKKGRPVSQCERCREARQSRRIHAKCTCDSEKSSGSSSTAGAGSSRKGKRFIPTVPTLPNGLKDAMKPQTLTEDGSAARQQVEALLNPCHCKDVYKCTCRMQSSASSKSSISPSIFNDGLSALAHVAACCAPASSPTLPAAAPLLKPTGGLPAFDRNGTRITFDPPSQPTRLPSISESIHSSSSNQRLRLSSNHHSSTNSYQPSLPSQVNLEGSSSQGSLPTLSNVVGPSCCSLSSTSSVSGGNCGCGQQCACVGCAYHETGAAFPEAFRIQSPLEEDAPTARPTHRANCGVDCPTCVDHEGGVEMPGTKQTPTFIDQFLQRAAALPPPPPAIRTKGASLDPTNVIVYPSGLFTGAGRVERSRAFGLVNIPKLECCGGRCSCPDDQCGCGDSCGGCCVDDAEAGLTAGERQVSPSVSFARHNVPQPPRSVDNSS